MTIDRRVQIEAVNPPGGTVWFALQGDSTYEAVSSGSGGIQIVDRPRLKAATQWYDRSPMSLTLPVLIDSTTLFGNASPMESIEGWCQQVDSWLSPAPGLLNLYILSVAGPLPSEAIEKQWMLYSLSEEKAIRDPQAGFRVQQEMKLVLYEYVPPLVSISNSPSPAQTAQQNLLAATSAASYTLYTVKSGDTLQSIAANLTGNASNYTVIMSLNNIRDPGSIYPGQVLSIP